MRDAVDCAMVLRIGRVNAESAMLKLHGFCKEDETHETAYGTGMKSALRCLSVLVLWELALKDSPRVPDCLEIPTSRTSDDASSPMMMIFSSV
jgi:hypothetical protein